MIHDLSSSASRTAPRARSLVLFVSMVGALASAAACGTTAPPNAPVASAPSTAPSSAARPPTLVVSAPARAPSSLASAAPSAAAVSPPTEGCRATIGSLGGDAATLRSFECPAGCESSWLWGDGVYTADSYLCSAAIHSGAIRGATGGKAFVELLPGQAAYAGTSRNGVSSSTWGSFSTSFRVYALGADGKPKAIDLPPLAKELACYTSARDVVAEAAPSAVVRCPSGCEASTVYGAGPYTDDSSVCAAAIHAGVITNTAGGDVRVTLGSRRSNHASSTRNGVTTRSWSSEYVTFDVTKP